MGVKESQHFECFTKPARTITRFPLITFLRPERESFPLKSEGITSQIFDAKKDADLVP